MSDQLDIFLDVPANIAERSAVLPAETEAEALGPNDFYIPPFGRVRIPVLTARNDRGIDALFKIVDQARRESRDRSILWKLCDLWWAALRRYEGGEAEYMEIVGELEPEVVQLATQGFAELRRHFVDDGYLSDILGAVFMRCKASWGGGWADQEFTPWNVCRMMARMTADELPVERLEHGPPITVHDPACGAGAMLLAVQSHVAERHGRRTLYNLECYGQDIDHLCCTMARIQHRMSNVPWMLSLLAATHADMAMQARGGVS